MVRLVAFTVRSPESLWIELRLRARREDRSMQQVVRQALRAHLEGE